MSDIVSDWRRRVDAARDDFLSKWTLARFAVVDAELSGRVGKQVDLFDEACVVGGEARVTAMGEGMLRGWAAASARMEGEPICSFLKGVCADTGVDVAIVSSESARQVALATLGVNGVALTPDEVAAMVGGLGEGFIALKQAFPDCVLERVSDRGEER